MDIRKLQRAIVDGLEDVKAQQIVVLNTEHLSPLFERVIIASGTSNRQTKALASSVRESVKSRGLQVLRTEGEENGEWIIVDCGAAVAHIMQPSIRDYYRLEEIWGGKPVHMKIDGKPAGAPAQSAPRKHAADVESRAAGSTKARAPADKGASAAAATRRPASPKAPPRSAAVRAAAAAPSRSPTRSSPSKAAPSKASSKAMTSTSSPRAMSGSASAAPAKSPKRAAPSSRPAPARSPAAKSPSAKAPSAKRAASSSSARAPAKTARAGARPAAKTPARKRAR